MPPPAKFGDQVIGIDFHMVLFPGAPNPVLFPQVFLGAVFDPLGAALSAVLAGGPVLVNGLPAATVTTGVTALVHGPLPPGAVYAPNDTPDQAGSFISGSQSVCFMGLSAGRTGSFISTCNFPLAAPTSTALANPSGVDVGGAEAISAAAALFRAATAAGLVKKAMAFRLKAPTRMSKGACTKVGHPVDVMTGEVLTDEVDFILPGPFPIAFERHYYSADQSPPGVLGPGWRHSFEACVDESPIRKGKLYIEFRLPDGRLAEHTAFDVGASDWCEQDRYRISRDAEGYTVEFVDGTKYRFEPVSKAAVTHPLVRIEDPNGNVIALRYQSGALFEAKDGAGRTLRFAMNGNRLVMVRAVRRCQAGDDVTTLVRFTYHGDRYLASAEDPAGYAVAFEYRGGVLIKELQKSGLTFHFVYDWYAPGGYCIHTYGEMPGSSQRIHERKLQYAKEHFATNATDGRGGLWQYFGNRDGQVEKTYDPMGVETTLEYDDCFQVIADVDGYGRRIERGYDDRGNVLWELDRMGHERRWVYNARDLPVEVVDAAGKVWRSYYDHRGNKVRAIDPLGGERRWEHDRRGLLIAYTNERGAVTRFDYDDDGNCIRETAPDGSGTRRKYDDLGRMVALIDPRGIEVHFQLDACGRVLRADRSDGAWQRVKRDADGNVIEFEDESRRIWRYRYAGMNKLVEQIDPDGNVIRLGYDTEEDLISVTNEKGEEYRFIRDKAGRVVKEIGFDGRTLECVYDQIGFAKRIKTANGQYIKIERDAHGRIVKLEMPGPLLPGDVLPSVTVTEYGYDARGDIVRGKNTCADVVFVRNDCGRVIEERAHGAVIESAYDIAGDRISVKSSLGHEAHYGFERTGALDLISFGHDARFGDFSEASLRAGAHGLRAAWTASIERDGTGAEVVRRLPGDLVAACAWDNVGRPAGRAVVGPNIAMEQLYRWYSDTEIATVEIDAERRIRYMHDRRGYLTGAMLPDGDVEHRPVDDVGNVYRTEDRSDRRYGKGGRIEQDNGEVFVHDDAGNLIERVLPNGDCWHYEWSALDQLMAVVRPDGRRVTFGYDAFNRRVYKEMSGRRTDFVWDGDDLLHEVPRGKPLVTWLWEPGAIVPSAKSVGGARYAVIADPRGAPMMLVDEEGEVAWHGGIDPLGHACIVLERTACPWRFAGQYYDEETGLSYNRMRYYDDYLGRYISPDPIGIDGGLGLYNYVRESWAEIDFFGLACNKATEQAGLALAAQHLQSRGYAILAPIQNRSGHGIDILARDAAGQLWAFEVKTTAGAVRAPALSSAQKKGSAFFVPDRLGKAEAGKKWWGSPIGPHVPGDARRHLNVAQHIQGKLLEVFLATSRVVEKGW